METGDSGTKWYWDPGIQSQNGTLLSLPARMSWIVPNYERKIENMIIERILVIVSLCYVAGQSAW